MVNMVFARFMTIYGHKFKSAFDSEDEIRIAKREWALSLRDYSEPQLVQAVNRCKETFVWMPSISEFISVLRESLSAYGLPAAADAYEEACLYADHPRQHRWSHPAVYHAGRKTDWFRLRTEDKPEVYPDFVLHYEQFCQRVAEGESFEVPSPIALPDQSSSNLAQFINQWAEQQGVTPAQAATLLYYLSKPQGPVRDDLRFRATQQAKDWGLELELPLEL